MMQVTISEGTDVHVLSRRVCMVVQAGTRRGGTNYRGESVCMVGRVAHAPLIH